MRTMFVTLAVGLALLFNPGSARAAGGLQLVKDINPTGASAPRDFLTMDGVVYFSANDGVNGRELWRSDGTAAGTWLVRDIYRGARNSNAKPVAVVGSELYFTAKDGAHGQELWKTDGTTAGTVLIKDLVPGTTGGGFIYGGVVLGQLFFFYLDPDVPGTWVTDGTAAGTLRLGPGFEYMTAFGDELYGISNEHLWRSDGTITGTKRLRWAPPRVTALAATDNALYLESRPLPKSQVCDLYITDGTQNGLRRLTAQPFENCFQMAVVGERVMFTQGHELWRSDGTPKTTKVVASLSNTLWETWSTGDCVWFNAWDAEGYPAELWRSDGTKLGTTPIVATPLPDARYVVPLGALSYFAVATTNYGGDPTVTWDLWQSDGTNAGTAHLVSVEVKDATEEMTPGNGRLFFPMDDGALGSELWSYAP